MGMDCQVITNSEIGKRFKQEIVDLKNKANHTVSNISQDWQARQQFPDDENFYYEAFEVLKEGRKYEGEDLMTLSYAYYRNDNGKYTLVAFLDYEEQTLYMYY
jgi:hypothetical protein